MSDNKMDSTGGEGTVHPDFASPDADIFIRSSDGIIFNLHRANILAHTTAFPIPEGGDPNIADFSEPSNVLAIAFAYLCPRPPLPDVNVLDFDTLEAVGYVAHKYQFAALMAFCDSCIPAHATKGHPGQVLRYAVAHGFPSDKVNVLALHTIDLPMRVARDILGPSGLYEKWIMYREDWLTPFAPDGTLRNIIREALGDRPSVYNHSRDSYAEQLATRIKTVLLGRVAHWSREKLPQWDASTSS